MEKIKSVLNPGKATEDEIMYGSGRVDDPVHSGNPGRLAGQGSHFNDVRDTKRDVDTGNATVGQGSHFNDARDAKRDVETGNATAASGTSDLESSRRLGDTGAGSLSTEKSTMPGSFPAQSTNPYSAQPIDPRIGDSDTHAVSKADTGYDTTAQTDLARRNTAGDNQHHYGRDAAAVGTAGALAEGIHHHRENERDTHNNGSSTTTCLGPNSNANAPTSMVDSSVESPHVTSTANRLDPSYNPSAAPLEDARHHTESGGGGRSADEAHGRSHLGRDAAVGAGGIGLEHEHRKHEHERDAGLGPNLATTGDFNDQRNVPIDGTNPRIGTHGLDKHQSEHARLSEPGYDPVTVPKSGSYGAGTNVGHDDKTRSNDHHYGRDAAAVGAVGAYEAEKHHKHDKDLTLAEREEKRELKHEQKEEKKHHGLSGLIHNNKDKTDTKHEEKDVKQQHPEHNRHLGRDAVVGSAAVGSAAVGGAAYEVDKKHHHPTSSTEEPDTMKPLPPAPGSDSLQQRQDYGHPHVTGTTGYQQPGVPPVDGMHSAERNRGVTSYDDSTKPATGHHGQEAAVGVGGVALAEHEHRKHEKDRPLDNKADVRDTETPKQHHLGRDAAVGVGGVGLAEHEHRKHEEQRGINAPDDSTSTPKSGGLLSKLGLRSDKTGTGAYTGDETNLPPSHHGQGATVGAGSVGLAEHEHRKHEKETPLDDSAKSTDHQHHLGRDAAIGVGGVGLAEHERRKHERERGAGEVEDTTGTHKSGGLLSKLGLKSDKTASGTYTDNNTTDPNLQPRHHGQEATIGAGSVGLAEHENRKHEKARAVDDNATSTGNQHHLGRDAALGVGGAGLAEHEHRKHESERAGNDYDDTTGTTGTHKSGGLLSKLGLKSDKTTTGTSADDTTNPSMDHRLGRDAVVGAGSVGLVEHEHRKHEKEREIDGEKAASVGHQHHHGRDAAIGVGGAGVAEHEHKKHERERGTNDFEDTAGTHKSGGLLSKLGLKSDKTTTGTYADETTNPNQDRRHLGRDAAVGAGGVGLTEHEHRKHEKERGFDDNEKTTHVGHQHHHKEDAAIGVGAAGLAEHEHRKHGNERGTVGHDTSADPPKSGGLLNKLGLKSDKTTTDTYTGDATDPNQDRHHLGRDAAVGAGGVGLAEHEHRKHEREGDYGQGNVETGVGGAHIPGTGPSRNLLHKDPPAGHPAAAGVAHSEANTDQDGRLVTGNNQGVVGAGTGIGTGTATNAYSSTGTNTYSDVGTGPYADTGVGGDARRPGTY